MSWNHPVTEENKRLAVRFMQLAADYQVEDCLALLAPEASWWVLGDPARLKVSGSRGREQIAALLRGMARLVPEPMQLTIRGSTAEGSRVAVEAECVGVWRNGATYHNRYHFLFEILDGKIAAVREYMDTLHVFDITNQDIKGTTQCANSKGH